MNDKPTARSFPAMRFDRSEVAGSLGDLGTLLPLTLGMVMVNGMSAVGTFYAIGLFYLLAGLYFRVPVAVQPMKAIGAYAIGTAMSAQEIGAATLLVSVFLAIIGITGTIVWIGRAIPRPVIRGVQLSTGILLVSQGVKLILGTSSHQGQGASPEPHLVLQQIGTVPISLILGICGVTLTLLLLNNKKIPAAIAVLGFGILCGVILGDHSAFSRFSPGLYLPPLLPFALPESSDFAVALFVLVLPQIPMTIGNATIATGDLSRNYFPESSGRVTYRSLTLSMALASAGSFLLGSIPLCHGAGGLAAHYRFGARTCGSNVIIGTFFLLLAVFFGPHAITLLHLLPLSVLGVLIIFAGAQLGLAILDMVERNDMFVILIILAITLTANLAWAFIIGTLLAHFLNKAQVKV